VSRPKALDLFCCGGGSAMGYSRAGFDVYGIDNDPKRLRDFPFPWLVMDAIEALGRLMAGEGLTFSNGETLYLKDFAFIHASPPCQGYSIMNNLPWIRSRTYPLLILPVRELLDETGLPYCIENVAGAASKKNLEKLGLLDHRLRAGWLCGGMFGLPIYRHRYFETNWFWIQPGHPKHQRTRQPESAFSPRPLGVWEQTYEAENPGRSAQAARVNTGWRAGHDGQGAIVASPYGASLTGSQRGIHKPSDVGVASHLTERAIGTNGKDYGNGAQKEGVAVGHAAGWKVAAEAMGIDWLRRSELTQAIPPCMTEFLGKQLLATLAVRP
jgi:site-specific DNA-cytosine methylase